MEIRDFQARIADLYIEKDKRRGVEPTFLWLMEEVGELAREVNHRFGEKTKKAEEPEDSIAMELADIVFVVICLANSQGIDLDDAFADMMRKVTSRDADRWTRKAR